MKNIYILLGIIALTVSGCGPGGGGGGGGPIDNTPIDNAPHIIEFTQPDTYVDGSKMSVPSSVAGYYLYICHVQDGMVIDNMVWIAEIYTNTHPGVDLLVYDNDAWRGTWDILDILKLSPELVGTRPDNTHSFALRAISTIPLPDGKPDLSPFSIPWVYGLNPYPLDNNQIVQEGDPYAQHPNNRVDMLFNSSSGDK